MASSSRRSSSSASSKRQRSSSASTRAKAKTKNATTTVAEASKKASSLKQQQQEVVTTSSSSSTSLLTWEQVPQFLQFNRFVRTGYRPFLSTKDAWKSMFNGLHNETANIWTHFIPFFIFLYFLYEEFARCHFFGFFGNTSSNVSAPHPPFRVLYALSAVGCMFVCIVSTCYHTLMCSCKNHSEYQNLICIDILGSVIVISTTALSMLIFGNPCFDLFTRTWMTSLFGLSTIGTIFAIFRGGMSAGQRFLMFGGHLLLRLALQFGILMPKYRNTGHFQAMELHTHSFLMLLVAGLFNVSRFPECLFTTCVTSGDEKEGTVVVVRRNPKFLADLLDYFGNSHNIWHVLSIYSCYLTFLGVAADYAEFHDLDGKVECGSWK